jgi:hypothetical protein
MFSIPLLNCGGVAMVILSVSSGEDISPFLSDVHFRFTV